MHSTGYQESYFLSLTVSPLGYLTGHPTCVWLILCGSSAFTVQTQIKRGSLGEEYLRDKLPGLGGRGEVRFLQCHSGHLLQGASPQPVGVPLCCACTSNKKFSLGRFWNRGFSTDTAACLLLHGWLPEQNCYPSCLPGRGWLLVSSFQINSFLGRLQ